MDYHCKLCNYSTNNRNNFTKHILTKKHMTNAHKLTNKNKQEDKIHNFICEKCNKSFSTKQWLLNHAERCKGVISCLNCSKCGKLFNTRSTRYKHELKCQQNIPLQSYDEIQTTETTNTINTDNSRTTNIVVNNFACDKIEFFMKHPHFAEFINTCIENQTDGICILIANKHLDPEHPENHNIRKMEQRDNYLRIFKDDDVYATDDIYDEKDANIPFETTMRNFMEKIEKENFRIYKDIFQYFMKDIATILEWNTAVENENQKIQNAKIYKLLCETIYNYTKMIQ